MEVLASDLQEETQNQNGADGVWDWDVDTNAATTISNQTSSSTTATATSDTAVAVAPTTTTRGSASQIAGTLNIYESAPPRNSGGVSSNHRPVALAHIQQQRPSGVDAATSSKTSSSGTKVNMAQAVSQPPYVRPPPDVRPNTAPVNALWASPKPLQPPLQSLILAKGQAPFVKRHGLKCAPNRTMTASTDSILFSYDEPHRDTRKSVVPMDVSDLPRTPEESGGFENVLVGIDTELTDMDTMSTASSSNDIGVLEDMNDDKAGVTFFVSEWLEHAGSYLPEVLVV